MVDKFELRREIFHVLVGILFLIIVMFFPYGKLFLFIILILGMFASFLSLYFKIPLISRCLCLFERDCNKSLPGKGVLFFFMGSLLSLQLFEKEIALAAIMILTFADPIAHFTGLNFGKTKIPLSRRKNIEGTLAGVIAGTIAASVFVSFWLAFLGSLFAMSLELAGLAMAEKEIDDNLLIPLIAGTIMHLLILI